jgi:hypothetical protein
MCPHAVAASIETTDNRVCGFRLECGSVAHVTKLSQRSANAIGAGRAGASPELRAPDGPLRPLFRPVSRQRIVHAACATTCDRSRRREQENRCREEADPTSAPRPVPIDDESLRIPLAEHCCVT